MKLLKLSALAPLAPLALSAFFSLMTFSQKAQAATYYFENPALIDEARTNCFFPMTISSGAVQKTSAAAPANSNSKSKNGSAKNGTAKTGTNSAKTAPTGSTAKQNDSPSLVFWQEADEEQKQIWISLKSTTDGIAWNYKPRIAGPFSYSGEIPPIYTVASNSSVTVLACLSSDDEISIYTTKDNFETSETRVIASGNKFIAPRVFRNKSGGFTLFVSQNQEDAFSLHYSTSKDGINWTAFVEFTSPKTIRNSFNPIVPFLVPTKTGDLVVYQAQYTEQNLISVQLYSVFTKDNGKTWTKPVLVTGASSLDDGKDFFNWSNQNPSMITTEDGETFLTWERSPFYSTNSDIWFCKLNAAGAVDGKAEKISTTGFTSKPSLFEFDGAVNLLWFTTILGNQKVYFTQKRGILWDDAEVISSGNGESPCYLLTKNGRELNFVWEEINYRKNTTGIAFLSADHSCPAPRIAPVNYRDKQRVAFKDFSTNIFKTEDSSGVRGYSWIWTQDPSKQPPETITMSTKERLVDSTMEKDGLWYFKVRQQDYAGNWSDSSSVTCWYDSTPPRQVKIADIDWDESGFASSNRFEISWTPDENDDDVAGYTYALKFIDLIPRRYMTNPRHPTAATEEELLEFSEGLLERNRDAISEEQVLPHYVMTRESSFPVENIRNGLWLFSVAPIDQVGNIGKAKSMELVLNKFIPTTFVNSVSQEENEFGDVELTINGGGFTYDGTIAAVYLDRDGKAPYDYSFHLSSGDYEIKSNGKISLQLKNVDAGDYCIGLLHTDRGTYMTREPNLTIEEHGTVKKKFGYLFKPDWKGLIRTCRTHTSAVIAVLVLVAVLFAAGFAASSAALVKTAVETKEVRAEVKALLEGDIMPGEKKRKAFMYKQKGMSLKSKLVIHSTILIAVMDILIFAGFGYYLIKNQKRTLARSLQQRVSVMLNSIASGTKIYLPQTTPEDNLSLTDIASQVSALSESNWATITGTSQDGKRTGLNKIWATTDMEILSRTEGDAFIPGTTAIGEESLETICKSFEELNRTASIQADDISESIAELTKEGLDLALLTDERSVARRAEIQTIRNQLSQRLDNILDGISTGAEGSIPNFRTDSIDSENTDYIFYKPILYKNASDTDYVHGAVFIKASTKTLVAQIEREMEIIIITCLVILAVALLMAFASTYIMASVIVRPIRKLVAHVAMIRDTEDKEKLSGKEIPVDSKDEIGMLGDTVNEMTRGLVEAAVQGKNLTLGKDIQTKFIPLEVVDGITQTTGSLKTKGADFFSYYAGADDLSGDYFDYKQLDDKHYAIIKCDVSGHGVPAALIMVEVATLFLNCFKNWSMNKPGQGINIAPVVGQINDLLESRGFKGRFAAFTLCIMNTETGECWFCNAGDNLVHIYDNQLRKKKVITLQETPAAGIFSTDLVDMKGGYKVSKLVLKKDDVLFLFTDGIEEAKRLFRDSQGQLCKCEETVDVKDGIHQTHNAGDDNEEMTPERVTDIIEAVFARSKYSLHKFHAPEGQADFEFDFTECEGTAAEAIMALVSVEKIFRITKPKNATQNDRVKADRNIDKFLRKHFMQYSTYCSDRQEIENNPSHIFWCGVKEDPQYDDLTLIAVKKS